MNMKAIRKMWAVGCIALLCAACSSATSDEPDDPTANEPVERYFTITNGDSEHSLIYRGGIMLAPSEVSEPLTLLGETAKYYFVWAVDGRTVGDTLYLDMTGKPAGITLNYTVRYE